MQRQAAGFLHPAGAGVATGLIALCRTEYLDVAGLQFDDVFLRTGFSPHRLIHGRGQGNLAVTGQTDGAQEIAPFAMTQASNEVCAGRGDEDKVCPAR